MIFTWCGVRISSDNASLLLVWNTLPGILLPKDRAKAEWLDTFCRNFRRSDHAAL